MTSEQQRFMEMRKKFESYIIPHELFADAIQKVDDCLDASMVSIEPVSCLITGIAGTGKSTVCKILLNNIEKKYPPAQIINLDSVKKTIPVFYCAIGSGITIKGLAKQMLIHLGAVEISGDQTDLTSRLYTLLKTCETKLILLDEFQHLLQRGAEKSKEQVCDWVKNLMNMTGTPVVILGTNECEFIVSAHPQLSRRYSYRLKLRPFEYVYGPKSDYVRVLKSFQKAFESIGEVSISPMLSDEQMALSIYIATGGLMDSIRKLLARVLFKAHQEGKVMVTMDDFSKAYEALFLEGDTLKKTDANPFELSIAALTGVLAKVNGTRFKVSK